MTFDLEMTLKDKLNPRNRFLVPRNMDKVVLHKALVLTGAEIWHLLFAVAAILNFAHGGR